jgi:hypothetical protein
MAPPRMARNGKTRAALIAFNRISGAPSAIRLSIWP